MITTTRHRRGLGRGRIGIVVVTAAVATCSASLGASAATDTTTTEGSATADTAAGDTTTAATTEGTTTAETTAGTIDADRCQTNRDAGTLTFSTSYDFAAAASIIDVVVADELGYFDDLCLDVEIVPGFATSNYALVAADTAQFASAGSYTEIVNFSATGDEFVAFIDYGKAPIEALVTPADGAETIEELEGAVVGAKGDIPPSIVALLAGHGLQRGEDYDEVLLEGFDPVTQLEQVDALPVYRSSEPGQLERAGVEFHQFTPADEGIPGSFGLVYTSKAFADEHPTVVEDFARAVLHGMEAAIDDPDAAVAMAVEQIDVSGNQQFLTAESEQFRWEQEMAAVIDSTPDGEPIGLIDPDLLRAEYDAYVEAGVWPDGAPDFVEAYDADIVAGLYDGDGAVVWP